ncbi:hypothetical protein [Shimia sp.]|uniref:hypothetical protein n=1 Tax=Shimia sp. TaxID=1954381 RepID=UPI003BAD1665
MTDAVVSALGQVEGSGLTDELFLKVFSGEVMTIFEAENVTKGRVMSRSITSGKSAQFPVMGRASAFYHTPGNEILGGKIKHNEKVITIDDLLISPVFIAEIDEAKNHYDVRGHYSTEVGRVLAQTWDKHALQVGVLAARTTVGNISGESPAGTVLTEAAANDFNNPDKLAAAFYAAAQTMDEKNIPEADRVAYLPPALYYALVQSDKVINRDFVAGNGDYAKGKVFEVAGIEIVKTNNLPKTNVTSDSVEGGSRDSYVGDFRKTAGLIMHKSAIGTVQLMDLTTRMDFDPRRLGTQVVSKYAVGHGVLRPEAAIELARA